MASSPDQLAATCRLVQCSLTATLLGCGDDDLFRFKVERKGRWNYLADQPATVPKDDPVLAGIDFLRALHEDRRWLSPAEMLDRIARDRRAFELGFAEGRPRDVWRRLRFVIDQARGWSDATGGSLREYIRWVKLQSGEAARVAEAVLPETDDDAVRIMTIHAAKGLEFPITIVSGMSTAPSYIRAAAEVIFPPTGEPGYKFGSFVETDEFEAWKPIDEQMRFDERIRLLYVACTRARDHLVVSLHRRERKYPAGANARTNAELLVKGMGLLLVTVPDAGDPLDEEFRPATVGLPNPPPPFDEWEAELQAALAAAERPSTIAATALRSGVSNDFAEDTFSEEQEAGLQKRPRDLEPPPWLKGRYGTAVGRAVHGVLQTIDLATGEGRDDAVAAQCQAEAIPTRADDVRRLVDQALASSSVREAASRPHWREVYACTPLDGGRLLEGYVDLLYRGPDGLVIVDYKTAATAGAQELDRRVEGYRLQGTAYALSIAAATAEPVTRVIFIFLTPDGAVERHLPDLQLAVAHVRSVAHLQGSV